MKVDTVHKDKAIKGKLKPEYPRVLVISHNCFSKTGSNGRTIGNFFVNWPKESIAQFYISNEKPDFSVCDNYFRVLDTEALRAFCNKCIKVGKEVNGKDPFDSLKNDYTSQNALYKKLRRKTSFNYIARNLIWDSGRWKASDFENWIEKFSPDVVFLQLGDYAFMIRIALRIAKERNIPLIIYNCEDYYFQERHSFSPLYHYYRQDYKRQVRKLIAYASHSIYISEILKQTYRDEFSHESTVIMTSTDIEPAKNKKSNSPVIVSYLGNLGLGRHEPIIEIAETLKEITPEIYLDIYGRAPNTEVERALRSCGNIRLKGFVSYQNVVKIIQQSDVLIYVENSSKKYLWKLNNAFSTKIADSLASGTCLFAYGPENIASIRYLKDNQAACIVSNPSDLRVNLENIICSEERRNEYVQKASALAANNHDIYKNARMFKSIICDAVNCFGN